MNLYSCKCGKTKSHGSWFPPICSKCDTCGSNLAQGPTLHMPPEPHDFVAHDVETDEGMRQLSRCRFCHMTRKELYV